MRVVAIIQARMGSARLPGKVLMDLAGQPMLARVVDRTRRARTIDDVVVATTSEALDEAIVVLCRARGWLYSRGSEADVLDRYYRAATAHGADVIVRITSDCPLIDPGAVDQVVNEFVDAQPEVGYASNWLPPRTFPRGLDTEAIRFDVLERAWREDDNPAWREHVVPYIRRHPDLFRLHGIFSPVDYSGMRWTVDTPEDMALVRRIYDYFGHDRFHWLEVLDVLEHYPDWLDINRHVEQKVV